MSDSQTSRPSPRLDPLGRISTPQAIANRMASEILDGYLEPGEELREVELSDRFGVSRPSLREAIAQLAFRGLVEKRPHRSVRVTKLSKSDAADIMKIRTLLEAEAIRRIAADPTKWSEVEEAVRKLDNLPAAAGWSDTAESDIAFHRAMVHAASSPRLFRAHDQLIDEMRLLLAPGRYYSNQPEMAQEHRKLFEGIRTGDPRVADELIRAHLERGLKRLIKYLPDDHGSDRVN